MLVEPGGAAIPQDGGEYRERGGIRVLGVGRAPGKHEGTGGLRKLGAMVELVLKEEFLSLLLIRCLKMK